MKQQRDIEHGAHEQAGHSLSGNEVSMAALDHNQSQGSFLRRVSVFGAVAAIVIAFLGLLGYVPGLGLLGSISEGYIPMAPSTAISFIVLSSILLALTQRSISSASFILFSTLAVFVSLFGALEVVGHFTGMDLNFEDAIVPTAGYLGEIPIARMSPSTGAAFLTAGLAVLLLLFLQGSRSLQRNRSHSWGTRLMHWAGSLGSVVFGIGLLFCLAYLSGSPLLYGKGATVPMALTTALAFMMLGAAAVGATRAYAFPLSLILGVDRVRKQMNARKRFIFLTFIMVGACTIVMMVMMVMLYRHKIEEHMTMLQITAQSQARLIEAIARHQNSVSDSIVDENPDYDAYTISLDQITYAYKQYNSFGDTGEFTLAKRTGDDIVFILRHRHDAIKHSAHVAVDSDLAEPMRRALEGLSGTVIGLDYRGETVLAAHEPIAGLNLGIVAKIDLAEIRAPIIRSGLTASAFALFVIVAGTILFFKIGNPIISRLEEYSNNLEGEISEREQAEGELRESEQKFRAITTAAQDAIIMMDSEGKVDFWNKAAERIFGWTEEETMGRMLHPIIVPAKYHDAHNAAFPAFQKTGRGAAIGQTVQLDACHKDGTEIPIELSLSAIKLDGQWCSIGMVRDISQRVEIERSQARLKAAIEVATETIVITDTDGVIQYVNPAFEQTTGYSREKAIGANPRVLNSGEHDEAFYQNLWSAISRGEVWHGQFTNKKKDGTIFYEDATISPIKDETGEIVNYVAVKRDVTQERMLETQLLQAQKLESIGQLAAGIAHEINTPIQYVGDNTRFVRDSVEDMMKLINLCAESLNSNGKLQSWQERAADFNGMMEELELDFLKEEIPKAIEQTLDGVDRIAEIVLAMKDFSHPGSDEKTLSDLNKAIQSTITVCRNRWKYVAELETDFEDGLPMVPCLVGELNQVILNIVVNAADAIGTVVGDEGDSKGLITVSTRKDGEFVEIRISDTGGGIPQAIQQKVFDPFFTTKEVGKGTGQGLAISHDVVVNKHGGTINFESKPGVGTTFIVRLPLAEQTEEIHREAA